MTFYLRRCALFFGFALITSLLCAQDDPETMDPGSFYGFWEIQESAGDSCILIVKRGGRLSCFWSGTSTSRIQKGSWKRTDGKLIAEWDNGFLDVYKTLGENAIERASYGTQKNVEGKPESVVRGVRVDSRIPGSLTTDSDPAVRSPNETPDPVQAPAIPLRNAYIGFWKIEQSTGFLGLGNDDRYFYLNLQRDGNATVSLRNWDLPEGTQGKWKIENDEVRIEWPDSRKDILRGDESDKFKLFNLSRKQSFSDKPKNSHKAEKVSASDASRYFQAGETQLLSVLDIRGVWSPKESKEKRKYIEIEGWGNAYRHPAQSGEGSDPGKWRLLNDRVVITWVDGSKDVIYRQPGYFMIFIQESFLPGQALTDTPHASTVVEKIENR